MRSAATKHSIRKASSPHSRHFSTTTRTQKPSPCAISDRSLRSFLLPFQDSNRYLEKETISAELHKAPSLFRLSKEEAQVKAEAATIYQCRGPKAHAALRHVRRRQIPGTACSVEGNCFLSTLILYDEVSFVFFRDCGFTDRFSILVLLMKAR